MTFNFYFLIWYSPYNGYYTFAMNSQVFISEQLTDIMSRSTSSSSKDKNFTEFEFVDFNYELLPFYNQLPEYMIFKMKRISDLYEGYFTLSFKVETTEFFTTDSFEIESTYLISAEFIATNPKSDTEHSEESDSEDNFTWKTSRTQEFENSNFSSESEEGELSDIEDEEFDIIEQFTRDEFIFYMSNIFKVNEENKKLRITDGDDVTLSYKDFFNNSKRVKFYFPSWTMAGI